MIYRDRWDFIRPIVEHRRVLDVGPAELVGTVHREKLDRWIHGRIAGVAAHLVGLERSREQVQALKALGYDIREADAEHFDLGEDFDVIFAGELIEHLSNPGLFLDCARRHLAPGGRLLITTPNRFSILALLRVLRTGRIPVYDKPMAGHVVFFDAASLSALLGRHGFSTVRTGYCDWVGAPSRRAVKRLVTLAHRFRPMMLPVLLAIAEP